MVSKDIHHNKDINVINPLYYFSLKIRKVVNIEDYSSLLNETLKESNERKV